MSREPFDAFLQGRGGGRGGAMNTPPRGRGTPRGRGRGRGGSAAPQDYTNVGGPVNYDTINKERYKKMDNTYTASPYSQSTPKQRTPNDTPGSQTPTSRSGSATPASGLGPSSVGIAFRGGRGGSHAARFDIASNSGPASPSPYAGIGQSSRGRGGGALKKLFGRGGGFGGRDIVDGTSRGAPIFVRGKTAFMTEDDQPDVVLAMAPMVESDPDDESSVEETKAMDTVEDILLAEQVESLNISPSDRASTLPAQPTEQLIPASDRVESDSDEEADGDFEGVTFQQSEREIALSSGAGEESMGDAERYSPSLPQGAISEAPGGSKGSPIAAHAALQNDTGSSITEKPMPEGMAGPTISQEYKGSVGFFLDATGTTSEVTEQTIVFESTTLMVLGEGGGDEEEDEEEEEIVFVPRGSAPSNIDDPVYYDHASPSRYDIASNVAKGQAANLEPIAVISLPSNGRKQEKKLKKAQQKKAGRRARRDGRNMQSDDQPRIGDSDIDWGSDGPPGMDDGEDQNTNRAHRAALRDHYRFLMAEKEREGGSAPKHAIVITDEENSASESQAEDIDMETLARFAKGVNGQQVMIHDTELDRQIRQEDEEDEEAWEDESDSEAPKVGIGHKAVATGRPRNPIEVSSDTQEDAIDLTHGPADDDLESVSDDSDASDEEAAGAKDSWRHVADSSQSEDSEEDSDEDIHAMFGESKRGKLTWADAADDMIEEMSRVIEENVDMLRGGKGNRAERKKLFKSIQNGDFGDDWSAGPAPKGKKAKKAGIPEELQDQWEKDRQKKAEFKRQRQLERLEAEFDLFPGARKQDRQRGKGRGKANKWEPQGWAGDSEEDERPRFGGGKGGKKGLNPVVDMWDLNKQIRLYLKDEGKTTMSLPPMDKFSRRKVHELANCYSLKSQSKGQGSSRFPILIKTSRSIIQLADIKQIDRILNSGPSYEFRQPKSRQSGPQGRTPGAAGRSGFGSEVRHKDGDVVGGHASAIGSENIGHRLLSMMGWSEGGRIGLSAGGLDAPISAIVKNSKLGLGA